MAESTNDGSSGTDGQTQGGETPGGDTPTTDKPFSLTQEEFNRQLDERVKRERAKFSDYKDVKAKADQFDKLAEASKTETERMADRLRAVEQERDAATRSSLRFRIAAKYKLSDDQAELYLNGDDEDTLLRQAEGLAALAVKDDDGRVGFGIDSRGRQAAAPPNKDDAARAVFGI